MRARDEQRQTSLRGSGGRPQVSLHEVTRRKAIEIFGGCLPGQLRS